MSKERELLRRVKVLLERSNMESLQRQTDLIIGEIKELLAQPEPFKPDWANYRQGVADSKREPLSDAQIAELWGDKHSGKTHMVKNFARAIEKAHSIGVDDE